MEKRNTQAGRKALIVGILLVNMFCLGLGGSTASEPTKTPDCSPPLWSVTAFPSSANAVAKWNPSHSFEDARPRVTFLNNESLIVYELTKSSELSSRVNRDLASSFQLRASVWDVNSGRMVSERAWGTPLDGTSLQVTAGGILVQTGPLLRFYSDTFTELEHVNLPQSDGHDSWIISISPSRKTVVLNHIKLDESHFEMRDGASFKTIKVWNEVALRGLYSISDARIAAADSTQQRILASVFGSAQWDQVADTAKIGCVQGLTWITDTIFAGGGCGNLSVMTLGSAMLFTDHSQKRESFGGYKIAVSQNAAMLAAEWTRAQDRLAWLDIGPRLTGVRIAVYNLSLRKRVLSAEVKPLPKHDPDFALSPDGTKLAILSENRLSVCLIPN